MFSMGPPLWGGAGGDPYAGEVRALFHFNEADGTTLPSSSLGSPSVANSGAAFNTVSSTAPKFGAGAWFANSGDNQGLKITANVGAGIVPYTLEFFVNPVSFGGFGRFFAVTNTSGSGNLFALSFAGGNLTWIDATGSGSATTGTMSTGTWYHIAICYESATVKVYLNGAQVFSSSSVAKSISNNNDIGIGCSVGLGGADGKARYDEFRWTHGTNRYPSGFTVPTAEFPNS